jgi:hypothetical protein
MQRKNAMAQMPLIESPDHTEYPAVTFLPSNLQFTEGFRDDVIVFARSAKYDALVVTNLPVESVPDSMLKHCTNIAELALLAYVLARGNSIEYAELDCSVTKMQKLAREFAAKFLQPLMENEITVVIDVNDFAKWFAWHELYGWGRSIRNPAGTEYA